MTKTYFWVCVPMQSGKYHVFDFETEDAARVELRRRKAMRQRAALSPGAMTPNTMTRDLACSGIHPEFIHY